MSSNFLQSAAAFFDTIGKDALNDLEVSGIPVLEGALQVLQKNPSVAGALAAKAYLLGNAPAALVSAETSFLQQSLSALSTDLQAVLASAQPATK